MQILEITTKRLKKKEITEMMNSGDSLSVIRTGMAEIMHKVREILKNNFSISIMEAGNGVFVMAGDQPV